MRSVGGRPEAAARRAPPRPSFGRKIRRRPVCGISSPGASFRLRIPRPRRPATSPARSTTPPLPPLPPLPPTPPQPPLTFPSSSAPGCCPRWTRYVTSVWSQRWTPSPRCTVRGATCTTATCTAAGKTSRRKSGWSLDPPPLSAYARKEMPRRKQELRGKRQQRQRQRRRQRWWRRRDTRSSLPTLWVATATSPPTEGGLVAGQAKGRCLRCLPRS
mmetsp:Transcript_34644/g.86946  ORF Transcript_34644/g.86946 Transcript_34644/m.86946 type:complete len:216 (+) Transcript_34644:869-1516(+)